MITPTTYFRLLNPQMKPYNIQIITEKGLGNGGFKFEYESIPTQINGRIVVLWISGQFVNMVGPFKNHFNCKVGLVVYPTDYNAIDGYTYICEYHSTLWGKRYSSDADDLAKKLIYMINDHFSFNTSRKEIKQDGAQIILNLREELSHSECMQRGAAVRSLII